MKFCGKCRLAKYCDGECQKQDWDRHKVECRLSGMARDFTKNPLMLAITDQNLGLVRNLVQEGTVDVNMTTNTTNGTALHTATSLPNVPIMLFLMEQGADKDKTDNYGTSPIYIAARNGTVLAVQCLVEQGADKDNADNKGTTPLWAASEQNHLTVVKYLVQNGADKNKADNEGCSPLFIATRYGHPGVVQYLLDEGVDVNQGTYNGTTSLYVAAQNGHWRLVTCLLEHGADKNQSMHDGTSPFIIAAAEGHLPAIRHLLESGADMEKANNEGCSPLYMATRYGLVFAGKRGRRQQGFQRRYGSVAYRCPFWLYRDCFQSNSCRSIYDSDRLSRCFGN